MKAVPEGRKRHRMRWWRWIWLTFTVLVFLQLMAAASPGRQAYNNGSVKFGGNVFNAAEWSRLEIDWGSWLTAEVLFARGTYFFWGVGKLLAPNVIFSAAGTLMVWAALPCFRSVAVGLWPSLRKIMTELARLLRARPEPPGFEIETVDVQPSEHAQLGTGERRV